MRAVYIDQAEIKKGEELALSGDKARHLIQVLRIQEGQEILVLNGEGILARSSVVEKKKKEIMLKVISVEKKAQGSTRFSLAIGQLKKEAMDAVLKSSCELGLSQIIILKTSFSQKYQLNYERALKIMISSLEQSNFPYLPKLKMSSIEDLESFKFKKTYSFTTEMNTVGAESMNTAEGDNLLVIGPEGGFSDEDLDLLGKLSGNRFCRVELPIMRAPTAVSCCLGYLKAFG